MDFDHVRCGRQPSSSLHSDVNLTYQIRFLDTDLLPASSPEDCPKVIKSGIDEGQHHKSPKITGPNGIATLLHRVGRPQLLEHLLDVAGTKEYDIRVRTGQRALQYLYVKRRGVDVEVCNTLPTLPLFIYTRNCRLGS